MILSSNFTAMAFPSIGDTERDQVLRDARVQGHAAGFAEGAAAARRDAEEAAAAAAASFITQRLAAAAELKHQVAVLEAAANAMHKRAVPVLETMEHAIAGAALNIAETVIGLEMEHGETSVRAALARALNPVTPAPVHTVRLHPLDLAALPGDASASVKFVADPSLHRGDAVAEYTEGFLDARMSTALARIRESLLGDGE